MSDVLQQLTQVLEARKQAGAADPTQVEKSYVASLHAKGMDKILKKVGEECAETLIAAKDVDHLGANCAEADSLRVKSALVYETADLWFHTLVMLSHVGLSADDVLNELARRFDLSGLAEKAARSQT